jgi:hypothetical protein
VTEKWSKKTLKRWGGNAPKLSFVILRHEWVQGKMEMNMTNLKHLNLHISKFDLMESFDILTLQMAQALSSLKITVKISLDVSHLNLAPCTAIIIFLIHSLHLPRKIDNKGEFKQNITFKCGQNAMNILNAKLIIIQISQLGASMRGEQHCLRAVYYT